MTGIRSSLEKDIVKALRRIAKGSPRFYKMKQSIMRCFISDLASIKELVPKLENVKRETFYRLVDFWRTQGHTAKTMQRKMSLFRRLMPLENMIPTNLELGIKYTYNKKYNTTFQIKLCDVSGEPAKKICSLQYYLGLKKSEAIRFRIIPYQNDKILISREIAYNNIDRCVPIISEEQKNFLESFLLLHPSGLLTKHLTARLLSAIHRSELNSLEIYDNEYFRYFYLQNRARQLEEAKVDYTILLKQLRAELGYRENRQIKEILKCHIKL